MDVLSKLFHCQFRSDFMHAAKILLNPFVWGWDRSIKGTAFRTCMGKSKDKQRQLPECLPALEDACTNSTFHIHKSIRTASYMLDKLWMKVPGVKVIHYVRDPRGMLLSRANTRWKKESYLTYTEDERQKALSVARDMCERMRDDLKWGKIYSNDHQGMLVTVRYEDLSQYTHRIAKDMYEFIGLQMPKAVQTWISQITSAEEDGETFQTYRQNSSATAQAWRNKLSREFHADLVKICGDVIQDLGYDKRF